MAGTTSAVRLVSPFARLNDRLAGIPPGRPPILLGLGIRELSMSAVSVPEVKAAIRAMTVTEAQALIERVNKLATAAEIRAMVSEYVFGLAAQRKGRA